MTPTIAELFERAASRREALAALAAAGAFAATPAWAQARSEPLQAWLDARAGRRGPVVLDQPFAVGGAVRVPKGMQLVVRADLRGTPRSVLILGGTSTIRFERCRVTDVTFKITDGSVRVSGLDYRGKLHAAAIQIFGPGPYRDVVIEDIAVADANFGVLRQGRTSTLTGATIRRGRFTNLRGDAVQWNVAPNDTGLLIEGLNIDGIDDPVGRLNWGMGVGVAGAGYTPDWNPRNSAKKFIIRDITGRRLRQLVHVEQATDFTISNIRGSDMSSRYSAKSNMPAAVVAIYGARRFSVRDVISDSGDMVLFAGVRGGKYIVPSTDYTVEDVQLANGRMALEMGGEGSAITLRRVRIDKGILQTRGEVSRLQLEDIDITSPGAGIEPIQVKSGFLVGPMARFKPAKPGASRLRVKATRGR